MAHNLPGGTPVSWPAMAQASVALPPATKKQKMNEGPASATSSSLEEQFSDDEDLPGRAKGVGKLSTEAKRFQHCEVEKRRRERMNRYMNELAQMIPACSAVPRRLDKLSILKMAVDHMKSLRGDPHSTSEHKPGFLTDDELKHLVVEAANGFMIIIECSWARVLFVSDTINDVLGESPDSWMGACFYDLLHPKDIQKVKGQLASFDLEEALKASVKHNASNSPLVMHTQSLNGLRRSFLCRVKRESKPNQTSSREGATGSEVDYQKSEDVIRLLQSTQQSIEQQYAVLHCTGFIRHLTTPEQQALKMEEGSSGACLIAVARLQHFGDGNPRSTMEASENEFVARVGVDGRYTYVDPRVVGVLGYLPQDLIGQVSYEYYHPEDIQKMVQLHHDAMKRRTPMPTVQYRFLSKKQKWVWLAMKAFSFVNPFSQQVEYVVCTNVAMRLSGSGEAGTETSTPALPNAPPSSSSSSSARPPDHQNQVSYTSVPTSNPADQRHHQQLMQQGRPMAALPMSADDDPLATLFPDLAADILQQTAPAITAGPSSSLAASSSYSMDNYMARSSQSSSAASSQISVSSSYVLAPTGPILTTPASTTLEENAATAHKFLEEYQKQTASPPHRKDMNFEFPPGLFPEEREVDLEGSLQAYQILQQGMDNPDQFLDMFVQREADPFRQQHMFGDIDFDVFD